MKPFKECWYIMQQPHLYNIFEITFEAKLERECAWSQIKLILQCYFCDLLSQR